MGCSKELTFSEAVPEGAHLSFYWTMDEAGGADKADSTVGHIWSMIAGSTAEAGLFSNGTQLDCTGGSLRPHAHGLANVADATVGAISSAGAKGISLLFWIKLVTDTSVPGRVIVPWFTFEFYSGGFVDDYLLQFRTDLTPGVGTASVAFEHQDFNGPDDTIASATFDNAIGQWHMVAGTLDVVNQELKLYVDGVLMDTQADPLGYNTTTLADFWFQNNYAGIDIGNLFNACVDELMMCLDGVLTQAQITALFNANVGKTWPDITPIVPYP